VPTILSGAAAIVTGGIALAAMGGVVAAETSFVAAGTAVAANAAFDAALVATGSVTWSVATAVVTAGVGGALGGGIIGRGVTSVNNLIAQLAGAIAESKMEVSKKGIYCGWTHKVLRLSGGPQIIEGNAFARDLVLEYSDKNCIPGGTKFRSMNGLFRGEKDYWEKSDPYYPRKQF